jgi:Ca2+-binding EF-hand superfamily protein
MNMATDTTFQERKFKAAFDLIDADKNGVVSWDDCYRPVDKARQELGWTKQDPRFLKVVQSQKACWELVLQANDLDHNGTISYKEYIAFFFRMTIEVARTGKIPPWALEYCHNVHRSLDLNGDGGVTQSEYAIYLRAIGSDADPKSVFPKLDLNKNGKVTVDEMEELLMQFVTSTNPDSPGNYLLTGKLA